MRGVLLSRECEFGRAAWIAEMGQLGIRLCGVAVATCALGLGLAPGATAAPASGTVETRADSAGLTISYEGGPLGSERLFLWQPQPGTLIVEDRGGGTLRTTDPMCGGDRTARITCWSGFWSAFDSHHGIDLGGGHDSVDISGLIGHDYIGPVVEGGDGNDVIVGTPRRDRLDGGAGVDAVYGNDGEDIIDGGTGGDHLFGGPGNDSLIAGEDLILEQVDRLDCGEGFDRARIVAPDVGINCEEHL